MNLMYKKCLIKNICFLNNIKVVFKDKEGYGSKNRVHTILQFNYRLVGGTKNLITYSDLRQASNKYKLFKAIINFTTPQACARVEDE